MYLCYQKIQMYLKILITQIDHRFLKNRLYLMSHLFYLNHYYQWSQMSLKTRKIPKYHLYQKPLMFPRYPMFLMLMMCR
jgi:hypothetical protein